MATTKGRSRTNTPQIIQSSLNRPLSRASTASVHSFGQHEGNHPPFSQPQGPQHINSHGYAYTQPQMNESHYSTAQHQQLIQAVHHMQQQENVMDPAHQQQLMAFSNDGVPLQVLDQNIQTPSQSFQMAQSAHGVSGSMDSEDLVKKKSRKGASAGGARDDRELRELINQNTHRGLTEVARDILVLDRSSKAEKMKQLFAMLWLRTACTTVKDASVPRNRVYSKYAETCGDKRVTTLNPASFGKLVRVIFPGINTRRLGVRGESKYHYVDLALHEELDGGSRPVMEPSGAMSRRNSRRQESIAPMVNMNTSHPPPAADTASFPNPDLSSLPMNPSQGRVFAEPYSQAFHSSNNRTASDYVYDLQFPSEDLLAAPDDLTISLPDIHPYLPAKYDEDAANALVALYRSHCTSLVDAVRFCKEKQFFKLYTSLHGTLTIPVQKLFAMPELAPWIKECDWMMYQKMVRNVSQLTLQVAPPAVLKFLDNIGKMLHGHISATFSALPTHVLEAKLEPATLFAHLLRQMLRVNSTAHAAAVALTVDNQREAMWSDWQSYVKIKRVMENVLPQTCALETVFHILANEVRDMLIPAWSGLPSAPEETVIDRISAFLIRLPSRFPNASARTILLCINALGSAAMREITVENGVSFQGWWLTKVFIDEYAHWLASLGGFLSHTPNVLRSSMNSPDVEDSTNLDLDMTNGGSGGSSNGNNDSRFSSLDADHVPDAPGASYHGPSQNTGNPSHGDTFNQEPSMSFDLSLDFNTSQHDPSQTEMNHDDSGFIDNDCLDDKLQLQNFRSLAAAPNMIAHGL
ncbi:hypothetical protein P280DRAFT_520911 [Massarina eburnea CBS 473.64]|uniref:RFX-type winged-helix domain-containing protein n=1 Tax=Massarina eburnea CBS 473.64 TaxID=1395130 RepID=A0A6A6RRW0_9PLEO|nr:hypothetical protein P280DRAFT_520911 [Massarina eburnea CBS 473.64]